MIEARFLQIHSLHGYDGALLNCDDSGLAKRLTYGGAMRTRISSQCLKRHWRMDDGVHSLRRINGAPLTIRSRETVTRRVIEPLTAEGFHADVVAAIDPVFQVAVYGEKGAKLASRQPLMLGEPEIAYLAREARAIAVEHRADPEGASEAAKAWAANATDNMKAMRETCTLPGGLDAALFGRMVTADLEANVEGAVHVAHAFTVHAEESESDYFTVVDDLQYDEHIVRADHIGESELHSGLFYGYVVVDRPGLVGNLGGDSELAGTVVERLIQLIATVSPGAKRGSTAPYAYASWMLVEAGDRQPRSLAEAFRRPCAPSLEDAEQAAIAHLEDLDRTYETGEVRHFLRPKGGDGLSMRDLAAWGGRVVRDGTA